MGHVSRRRRLREGGIVNGTCHSKRILFRLRRLCDDLATNTYSIPKEKCVDCGQCRDICPGAAIIPGADARKILSIHIDEEACIGCSLCSRNCPANAITGEVKHPFTIHEDKCIKCGFCLTKCRKDAIRATFSTVFAPPVI